VADSQELAAAVLRVAGVVGPCDPIEVPEPQATRDLSSVAAVGLLAELLQVELARVAHQDVETGLATGVHQPAVEAERLHRDPAARREAPNEGDGAKPLLQALVSDPLLGDPLAASVEDADLDHGAVEVDSDVRCGHGQLLGEGFEEHSDGRCSPRS
jgi:hypothetical protein